ncbi:triose-phosphate isomerase [Roseovarius sp. 217]|uniref:triose-phosphate isomerase n=1 Tax=Roseovarius sp. (strain 217) TaxID=314264 RepID=UPI0000685882|nr:triose-phosphate isomerase [Roseovarius sp. 217]EAQ26686.1 triosephosphate isomerase [Roseovarius sp. 217]
MRRKLAAGNWKMNGTNASLTELQTLIATHPAPQIDILICPPATLIVQAAGLSADSPLQIGAQDCHSAASGAHTGDLSAPMLADAGATAVLLGHSERRQGHNESNGLVADKVSAAHAARLIAILCLGESLAQREAAQTLDVIADQLRQSLPDTATATNTVIAYEPIWAIGTGLTPSTAQIAEVHAFLRAQLGDRFGRDAAMGFRLLYGGSVKPGNAADIFAIANVDGALVGGASLTAHDFSPIITALENAV